MPKRSNGNLDGLALRRVRGQTLGRGSTLRCCRSADSSMKAHALLLKTTCAKTRHGGGNFSAVARQWQARTAPNGNDAVLAAHYGRR